MQSTPFRPEFLRKSSAERSADSWRQSLRSLDVGFRASTDTGLALPTDIRRGATLAAVLLRFGSAFRHHPERLDAADKAALYARSRPVERLDAFVSHSWSSPGYQKYLSLLFAEVSRISLAAAAAGGFAVYLLQHRRQELLPGNFVVEAAFSPLFLLPQVTSPYEFLAANLLALLSFAAAPALLTRRYYFVDCLCIHQTDHDLKLRGIRHLGGFLSRSSKLVVLWDESYFRRLWCIYEIAVFKAVHPEAPVQLHPLRLSVATALLASFFVLGAGLYVGIYPYVAPFGIGTFYAASFSCSAVVFGGSAVAGHDFARQRSALVEHLSAFDARSARCYSEADRAEIVVAIERMYGGIDSFNRMVRGKIMREVLSSLSRQRGLVPYRVMATGVVLPGIGFFFFAVSWFRHASLATQLAFGMYMVTFVACAMPLLAGWSLEQGSRLPPCDGPAGLRRFWRSYLSIGLQSASLFIFGHASAAFILPLAVANTAAVERVGLPASVGGAVSLLLAAATNAPLVHACVEMYRSRPAPPPERTSAPDERDSVGEASVWKCD
mmetsp:Transcript_51699/g.171311  ORF Transcript_51699/g.171311 Transcript_51699/m.171311 type:complete len:551 (+) Transcript_51699:78-1730(+)